MFNASELFDLSQTEHAEIFSGCQYAWEALGKGENGVFALFFSWPSNPASRERPGKR
jgi:hypothetical protein